jgi:hypothetical protein
LLPFCRPGAESEDDSAPWPPLVTPISGCKRNLSGPPGGLLDHSLRRIAETDRHTVVDIHQAYRDREIDELALLEDCACDPLGGEATVDFLPRGVVYTVICSLEGKS